MVDAVWQSNYDRGRYNRYPFDSVVSFVLSTLGKRDRALTRVLDYGCGGGNHTKFLLDEGFDTYAIDGSAKAVELTGQYCGGRLARNHLAVGDFGVLPFDDAFFDAVIDRQSLAHNPNRQLPVLVGEIRRILKPKGLYFGSVLSAHHPQRCFGKCCGAPNDQSDFSEGSLKDSGLIHFFTFEEIRELFAGFRLLDVVLNASRSLTGPVSTRGNYEQFLITAEKP